MSPDNEIRHTIARLRRKIEAYQVAIEVLENELSDPAPELDPSSFACADQRMDHS